VGKNTSKLTRSRGKDHRTQPRRREEGQFPLLAHFTRLSVGVQSFSDSVLKTLGRDKLDYEKLLDLLSHWDVSVDLMAGVPGQTRDEVLRDLISVVALGVPHISVYPLEVHEEPHFGGITAGGIGTMPTCYSWWRNSLRSTVMNTTRFQTMPDRGTNVFTTKSTGTTRSTTL